MPMHKKPASEKSVSHPVSFHKGASGLIALGKAIGMKGRSKIVNAAIATCLQALRDKKLMREDFHLSQIDD